MGKANVHGNLGVLYFRRSRLEDAIAQYRSEVALLEEWVKRGAPSPEGPPVALAANAAGAADAKPKQVGLTIEEGKKFWSFVPPVKPAVPAAANNWPRTDIDRFIAAPWAAKGLKPAGDADRVALLRRASFDLTGLPPSPASTPPRKTCASSSRSPRMASR
mgnify:CR=1 FL=1